MDTFVVDLTWVTLAVSIVLPILVGIVTKQVANGRIKAALLLFFSALTGMLNQVIAEQGVLTKETIIAAVVAYVVATASHFGFWKPVEVTGSEGVVQTKTSDFGVG